MRTILRYGILLLCTAGTASAITFSGSTLGSWENVDKDGNDVVNVSNNDDAGFASFRWGTDAGSSTSSILKFDGEGSDAGDAPWVTVDDAPFRIGDLWYRNGASASWSADGVTGVDLSIDLSFIAPSSGVTQNFAYDFSIINTPNTGSYWSSADLVIISDTLTSTIVSFDSVDYKFELLGFSKDGTQFSDRFVNPEGKMRDRGLYAQFTDVSSRPVPDGGSAGVLLACATAMMGFLRRRMRD